MVPFFQHQLDNIKEDRKKFGIFKGTGSGKTRIACALARGLTLVICPKTQKLDSTWDSEWEAQGKNRSDLIVISKEQFKIALKKHGAKSITNGTYPQTLIIDECHTVSGVTPYTRQKNYVKFPKTSQIFEAVIDYIRQANPERIYPVTATPDAEPMKVLALSHILGAKWDFFKFRDMFYFERTGRGRILYMVNRSQKNKTMMAELVKKLGWVGRLDDWFDVPDQIYKNHICGVSKAQADLFFDLKMLYPDPLVFIGKAHQLEQGLYEGEQIDETKLAAIDLYFHEYKRIVVFAKYTAQIKMYQKHFEKKGVKVFVLNGQTKDSVRQTITKDAEASEECVFIAQTSISAGWELPTFPAMIFASLDHSFINYDQAIGRIQRTNNIKKNTYIFLIAGSVDKRVKTVVDQKLSFSEAKFAKEFGQEIFNQKKL